MLLLIYIILAESMLQSEKRFVSLRQIALAYIWSLIYLAPELLDELPLVEVELKKACCREKALMTRSTTKWAKVHLVYYGRNCKTIDEAVTAASKNSKHPMAGLG